MMSRFGKESDKSVMDEDVGYESWDMKCDRTWKAIVWTLIVLDLREKR